MSFVLGCSYYLETVWSFQVFLLLCIRWACCHYSPLLRQDLSEYSVPCESYIFTVWEQALWPIVSATSSFSSQRERGNPVGWFIPQPKGVSSRVFSVGLLNIAGDPLQILRILSLKCCSLPSGALSPLVFLDSQLRDFSMFCLISPFLHHCVEILWRPS